MCYAMACFKLVEAFENIDGQKVSACNSSKIHVDVLYTSNKVFNYFQPCDFTSSYIFT